MIQIPKKLQTFTPHPLVRNGHSQTVFANLVGNAEGQNRTSELTLELRDGDRTTCEIDTPNGKEKEPIILGWHGLGGCSKSQYLLRLSNKLSQKGYRMIRINHRGCGDKVLAKQIYHAHRLNDFHDVIVRLSHEFKDRPFYILAFSLSANMLLNFFGRHGARNEMPWVKRIMVVNPPVDLDACSAQISRTSNFMFDRYFTYLLKNMAWERHRLFSDIAPPNFPRNISLRKFDETFVVPNGGFKSLEEYYDLGSSLPHLENIQIPTQILTTEDDPLIPIACIRSAKLSSSTNLCVQKFGGHMGFISKNKTPYGDNRWMDWALIHWVLNGSLNFA